MDYLRVVNEIAAEAAGDEALGKVASYIPELAKVSPNRFGLSVRSTDGQEYSAGDSLERFSTQSISKVFSLALALSKNPTEVWNRIGVEPSGDPFNSLALLETEAGIPRNPLLNAGAIVVCDILLSLFDDALGEVLDFIRGISRSNDINYDPAVSSSEAATGHRNRGLAYLMRSFGNIKNNVDDVLDLYVKLCAISMNCVELARASSFLADHGRCLGEGEVILQPDQTRRINAVMLTCGFYDEAGDFAFSVGLPGKSGVGGGIIAVCPGRYSVATWSPRLTAGGNSYLGKKALERLTQKTTSSIF